MPVAPQLIPFAINTPTMQHHETPTGGEKPPTLRQPTPIDRGITPIVEQTSPVNRHEAAVRGEIASVGDDVSHGRWHGVAHRRGVAIHDADATASRRHPTEGGAQQAAVNGDSPIQGVDAAFLHGLKSHTQLSSLSLNRERIQRRHQALHRRGEATPLRRETTLIRALPTPMRERTTPTRSDRATMSRGAVPTQRRTTPIPYANTPTLLVG
ncbi:MAG: hypothetical protein ABI442_07525 [Gemmatimonadaceae bacterium]